MAAKPLQRRRRRRHKASATLTPEVNGRSIATVQDAEGLAGGNVGMRVGSGESTVTLAFENFVLKYP